MNELNEAQQTAVSYCSGPALVIAGAGSGKTRVITYKLAHLISQGWDPHRLYALTFTNKAAREMRQRVEQMLGGGVANAIKLGTFHSVCGRLLRIYAHHLGFSNQFSIYDTSDTKSLVRSCIKDLDLSDKIYTVKLVMNRISEAKNLLISPQAYAANTEIRRFDSSCHQGEMYQLYSLYTQRCKQNNAMDFDDLLYQLNVLIRDFPQVHEQIKQSIDYLLIDEYQDTNTAQFELSKRLVEGHQRIFAVGDDAQSIYSFRGARIANILSFRETFAGAKLFKLEQNYRSTEHIVETANALIAHNEQRIPKHVFTKQGKGEKLSLYHYTSGIEEAHGIVDLISELHDEDGVPLSSQAILYRTNAQSRVFEEVLRQRAIPYNVYGGTAFYGRAEIKNVLAYLQLIVNPHDDMALLRALGYPKKGIGAKTIERFELYAASAEPRLSLFDAMCRALETDTPEDLKLSNGTRNKVASFVNQIADLTTAYTRQATLQGWLAYIIRESGIAAEMTRDDSVEGRARLENVQEFISSATEFEKGYKSDPFNADADTPLGLHTMTAFTQQIPLLTDQDKERDERDADQLQLMTIHSAKGLEFEHVYIAGVEETLLPSSTGGGDRVQVEEERRLLYVAITRAMRHCTLSYTSIRTRNGKPELMIPSRFLKELSTEHCVHLDLSMPVGSQQSTYGRGVYLSTSRTTEQRPSERRSIPLANQQPANPSASVEGYSMGDRVQHPSFGRGVVMRAEQSGIGGKLTIRFDDGVTRDVLVRYTKIEKL